MYRPAGSSVNSKIPCEFVLIVFPSLSAGDERLNCTRRIARPPSTVVTLPLMTPVPLATGAVGSRGGAGGCGVWIVPLDDATCDGNAVKNSEIAATVRISMIIGSWRRGVLRH